jgi:hypothetical protein
MPVRSKKELEEKLEEQLAYLQRSANLYDQGNEDEAPRLAIALRILLHDTPRSRSLLGQLERKNIKFFDSAVPFDPKNVLPFGGLINISLGAPPRYVPMFDNPSSGMRKVGFAEWWDRIVFCDQDKRQLSRKGIVITAANQDGGAHVDPILDDAYAGLSKNGSLGWLARDKEGPHPLQQPQRAAIRQIAHEVLKSLIPGYSKASVPNRSVVVGPISLTQSVKFSGKRPTPHKTIPGRRKRHGD